MKDVALVLCPPWSAEVPPIGLAYLKRYLEVRGKSVEALDLNLLFYRNSTDEDRGLYRFGSARLIDLDFYQAWRQRNAATFDESLRRILAAEAPVVGFSVNCYNKLSAMELAREVKRLRPAAKVVFGGFALCVNDNDRTLRYGVRIDGGLTRAGVGIDDSHYPYFEDVDCIGIGEGEVLLDALVEALARGDEPGSVPGVVSYPYPNPAPYRLPPLVTDLDQIPSPDYEGLDLAGYDRQVLPIIFSRGCICRCAFCTDPISWRKYRHRPPAQIVEELRANSERHGVDMFLVNDQIVNGDLGRLSELCDRLIESGLGGRLRWGGNAVVRADMPADLYVKMRQAGCSWLIYGVESGSDKVLARMNKMFRSRAAFEKLKATHDAGIRVCINIIVGFPGEGEQEFAETNAFLQQVAPHIDEVANLNPLIVSPRTSLERKPERYGLRIDMDEHWKYWTMEDGSNTFPERMARVRRVRDFFAGLGKPINFVNELDVVC